MLAPSQLPLTVILCVSCSIHNKGKAKIIMPHLSCLLAYVLSCGKRVNKSSEVCDINRSA